MHRLRPPIAFALALLTAAPTAAKAPGDESANTPGRKPKNAEDLATWLARMKAHAFSRAEMAAATGLGENELPAPESIAATKFPTDRLAVLPYPGGRHPRIGFLDGAVNPQRETKMSVFLPWNEKHYIVADVPEAIWWDRKAPETAERGNRELLYLAHTHIPTYWDRQSVALEPLEWSPDGNGGWVMERRLPNGVTFGTRIVPLSSHVAMEQWIVNGTGMLLTGLRVQNCVMLKGAPEFAAQTDTDKVYSPPYAACRDESGKRWVIVAWSDCQRAWGNTQCPCLHSDPRFPDCPPGGTSRLRGWLSFYEGDAIEAEFQRIEGTGWRNRQPANAPASPTPP
ncbi:MAG: hypothetical protein H7A53_02390 [Akkermansiaceae bacterium]|nr:hypothetical protein [Akkermansiaceae bacterium]MCP5549734.1 hypothetical protein [Akkermansiaceae bacterium]